MLFGALFQYVHGIFTQLAHRMHEPQEQPLGDIGFKYLPVGAEPRPLQAPNFPAAWRGTGQQAASRSAADAPLLPPNLPSAAV